MMLLSYADFLCEPIKKPLAAMKAASGAKAFTANAFYVQKLLR